MSVAGTLERAAIVWLAEASHRTVVLPLVVFFPTSRCNSRCLSCTWWTSDGSGDLTIDEIDRAAASLRGLGARLVVFSGGEPLVRPDLFDAADCFRRRGLRLHLLTSGLALAARADGVASRFDRVIVSLDAPTRGLYADIRGVDGLDAVGRGVAALKSRSPAVPVTARATLHRGNYRELPALIRTARAIGMDGISFLAADVSSDAFGRASGEAPRALLLTRDDVRELRTVIDRTIEQEAAAFASGFVAERPEALRRIAQHYAAMLGDEPFPAVRCNAPWVSAVIEANGDVRPCFFHPPVGNLRETALADLLRRSLPAFRRTLTVSSDPICERCVCSLKATWRRAPWN